VVRWTYASIRQAVRNRRRIRLGPASVAALCLVLALAILALDYLTPLGIADGMLYVTVLLLAPAARKPVLTGSLAAGCTLLVGVGYWISPTVGVTAFIPVTNRILSVGMVWSTALLVLSLQRARSRIEAQRGALERANMVLTQLARLDGLTGICNRRCFDTQLQQEARRVAREAQPLALLMIDIDHFKDFNDTYGHATGDRVLQTVAHAVKDTLREPDVCSRHGGEEFAVLLPNTSGDSAYFVADRVRRTLRDTRYTGLGLPTEANVTISIGVATCPRDATVLDELMELADKALYQAKADGRDTVVLWGAERRERVRM